MKVLVFGDIMLDVYHYGTISRVSPEAPVLILDKKDEKRVLGGAGNVARNLCNMGNETALVGSRGRDEHGLTIVNMARDCGIHLFALLFGSTILKERFVSDSHHLLRMDTENCPSLVSVKYEDILARHLKDVISSWYPDFVVVADYN